ncbi:MAG: hypothetical protein ABSG17_18680 [Spirochaetia bacterium]|jgi:hypothetical protein
MAGRDKEDLLRYRKSVQLLISQYVPKGKSLDSILEDLAEKWNPLFDTQQKRDLVEDVNALVRDYIRPIKRNFFVKPPDTDRIHALAEQLSASKSLSKIKKKEALVRYFELYMVTCLDVQQ